MNVAIIGCGLIGRRRAQHLAGARLVHCVDTEVARASAVAATSRGCEFGVDWRAVLDRADVDAVIIATPHHLHGEMLGAAIDAGKHVLIEKPAARRTDELRGVAQQAARRKVRVRVGFNHRYHRAFQHARRLVDEGVIGPLYFIRGRYGHGGRPGYEREWRARPELAGGGELIDQGIHLIDLSRWFLGDFCEVSGFAHTYFWDMPVEDNGFLILKTSRHQVAFLHASCTEWKNTFSWELVGQGGKLQVEGLGGSYGTESLTLYRMLPGMGPPETTRWEYPMEDNSWTLEMTEFLEDIRTGREPQPGLQDAIAALTVVGRIYAQARDDHRA